MPKQQPWMISYEFEIRIARGNDGGSKDLSTDKMITVIGEAPWKFIAQQNMAWAGAFKKPYLKDGERFPDRIVTIFWAVQIPMGGLTDEEVDALS